MIRKYQQVSMTRKKAAIKTSDQLMPQQGKDKNTDTTQLSLSPQCDSLARKSTDKVSEYGQKNTSITHCTHR